MIIIIIIHKNLQRDIGMAKHFSSTETRDELTVILRNKFLLNKSSVRIPVNA